MGRPDDESLKRVWAIAEKRALQIIRDYGADAPIRVLIQYGYLQALYDTAEAKKRFPEEVRGE